jgi:hypothetical protein
MHSIEDLIKLKLPRSSALRAKDDEIENYETEKNPPNHHRFHRRLQSHGFAALAAKKILRCHLRSD